MIAGGTSGIGLALAYRLAEMNNTVYILGRHDPAAADGRIKFIRMNLLHPDFGALDDLDINGLIISAGFGRLAYFEDITLPEIKNSFRVNTLAVLELIKKYYEALSGQEPFPCAVISSITGAISSPLYALYSSTKAAVFRFIESLNVELEHKGTVNRILNVAPGRIKGTRFHDKENDLNLLWDLADRIIQRMYCHDTLYIPDYGNVYKSVIERYRSDSEQFGRESLQYKLENSVLAERAQVKKGYLSGTFYPFDAGRADILRRASGHCDYLVAGVYAPPAEAAAVPLEETLEIVRSIRYVDEAFACPEDDAGAYDTVKYDYLFVEPDRTDAGLIKRCEEYFKGRDVQIIRL